MGSGLVKTVRMMRNKTQLVMKTPSKLKSSQFFKRRIPPPVICWQIISNLKSIHSLTKPIIISHHHHHQSHYSMMTTTGTTDSGDCHCSLQGPTSDFPDKQSLMEFFQSELAQKHIDPDTIALMGNGKFSYTFHQLDTMSTKIAQTLKEKLIGPDFVNHNPDGDIVIGVCLKPSNKLVLYLFAILKLGATYVPIDVNFPQDRINHILSVSKPVMVLTEPNHQIKFDPPTSHTKILSSDDVWRSIGTVDDLKSTIVEPLALSAGISADESNLSHRTAFLFFTTGSTGIPRGVRLSHRATMNQLKWGWDHLSFHPNDVSCFKTTVASADTIMEIFLPLLRGLPLVVFDRKSATQMHRFLRRIREHQVTRLMIRPSHLEALLTSINMLDKNDPEKKALDSIRFWMCTSEVLTLKLVTSFFQIFPQGRTLCNLYGSTETMCDNNYEILQSVTDVERKCVGEVGSEVPLGQPIYNTINYILDTEMKPVKEGEVGEIFVSSPSLGEGYVGHKDLDKFMPNPFSKDPLYSRMYRTGDFGRIALTKDGQRTLFFKGRNDSQIKVRGHRVDLSEIQAAIDKLPFVKKGVVLCFHQGQPDQAIVAFVEVKEDGTAEKVMSTLHKYLLKFQMPIVRLVQEIPQLTDGKIDPQPLLLQFHEERLSRQQFKDWKSLGIGRDHLASLKALVETISKCTGTSVEEIVGNLDESFYFLGGTSLNSITVVANLKKLNYAISIPEFVSASSIREIHRALRPLGSKGHRRWASLQLGLSAFKKYGTERLTQGHKEEVIQILSSSLADKGDLMPYVNVMTEDFEQWIQQMWSHLLNEGHSYVIRRRSDDKIIAACLNHDFYDMSPYQKCPPDLEIMFKFLDDIQGAQRKKLPVGKRKLLLSSVFGTHESLTEPENVYMAQFSDEENIRLAKSLNFIGVISTNISPVFQQIGNEVLGFETLKTVQINKYVTGDGRRPFAQAPDSQKVIVCWKKV